MIKAPSPRSLLAGLVSVLFLGACSGSDGGGTTQPEPDPTISISASPSSLQVEQGSSGEVTISVTRGGGFTGAVTVVAEGLPEGVQAPSVSVPAGSTTGTLIFTASSTAPATTPMPLAQTAEAGHTPSGRSRDSSTSAPSGTVVAAQSGAAVQITLRATAAGVAPATAALSFAVITPPPPPPTGAFTLAVDPGTISVEQGGSGTVTVNVSRDDPFGGAVTLAVSGAPDGVDVGADPVDVTGASSTLTVQVGESAAPGTYTLTVTGSGDGVDDGSATFDLTVTEAATGSFGLALSTEALSLQQGSSGSINVSITRQDPFDGPVALVATGAPSGATVSVSPAQVTGATSVVTIDLAADAAVGVHTVTITGSGDGVADQSATLSLTVTARPSGAAYSLSFCPTTPTWFAVKDGAGDWQAVGATGNTFSFNVASDVVGVAWVITGTGGPEVNVRFLGTGELAALASELCPGTRSVNGTTTGVGATNVALISMGGATASVTGAAGTTFTLDNIRDGVVDLFATNSTLNFGTGGFQLGKVFLQRGLDPADGATVSVDFTGADAFDPGSATVTANGLAGRSALLTMIYVTSGATGVLFQSTTPSGAASRPFPTVPAGRQADGDLHGVTVTTMPTMGNLGDYESASMYFRSPTDRTVNFGPVLGTTTLTTDVTAPYLRPRVAYSQQSEYGRYFYANYQQQGSDRSVTIYMTDDFFGSGDIDLIVPDFSGTSGWNNAWGLVPGEQMTYAFVTSGWDGGGAIAPTTLAEGLEVRTATRTGQINP